MAIILFPESGSAASGSAVKKQRTGRVVLRRGTRGQGRALEALGHAVEYLVDSRLFNADDQKQQDEDEAVQVLMRLSRAVFAECPEVVPVGQRLRRWVVDRFDGERGMQEQGR